MWSHDPALVRKSGYDENLWQAQRNLLPDNAGRPGAGIADNAARAARCAELLGEGDVCKVLQWLEEEAVLRVPPSGSTGVRVAGAEEG